LAKTHRSLTFDELCEEAFGSGLHPWEFYQYDLSEFLHRRRGLYKDRKGLLQQQLVAAMLPHMKKDDRLKIIKDAFREDGAKTISLKEHYKQLKERYIKAGVLKDGQ
jgi:hypothetical protein